MSFHPLDVVVLNTDLPAQGLTSGDLGAVVDVYGPDSIDVEFVTASGLDEGPDHSEAARHTRGRG